MVCISYLCEMIMVSLSLCHKGKTERCISVERRLQKIEFAKSVDYVKCLFWVNYAELYKYFQLQFIIKVCYTFTFFTHIDQYIQYFTFLLQL